MPSEERRKIEWAKVVVELTIIIVTNIVLVVGAYYKLDGRVTMTEEKLKQETAGYATLLSTFNTRMDKLDEKMQCLIDKRFCH